MATEQMPIAVALAEVLEQRGMTSADLGRLVRAYGVPAPTMRNILEGKVRIPGEAIRTALDELFAPGMPGTTLRVAQGRLGGYPSDWMVELVRLARPLPSGCVEHLVGFLRELPGAS